MADIQCYYLDAARNQQGPVAPGEIARLVRGGTIRRDTLIWATGMADWRPAGETSEFASLFAAPRPPAAPPPPLGSAPPPMQRRASSAGTYPGQDRQARQFDAGRGDPGRGGSGGSMGFVDAIVTCLRKYVDFKGRARRPEYWYWFLFQVLLFAVILLLQALLASRGGGVLASLLGILFFLVNLALLLPSLAVSVRRLHDTDRSGWWILIGLVPLVGSIVILVFMCLRGTEGANRFGEDDLAVADAFD